MRKILTLILATFYIGSSTGATLHMHYCMGELVKVQLWHKEDTKKCNKCGKGQGKTCSRDCCKDEHKTIKLEKDQKTAETAVHLAQLVAIVVPVSYNVLSQEHAISQIEEYPVSNAPPRSSKVHPHIINCIFRI